MVKLGLGMGSLLATSVYALRGGWKNRFTNASVHGLDYDELVASLVTKPSCRMILDMAASSGRLHGEIDTAFPRDVAIAAIGVLLGKRPMGSLVVAMDRITQFVPVPATLDYVILMHRDANVVTYTIAFPGTAFGNSAMQIATDINPMCADFDLCIDNDVYGQSFWTGFYASVAGGGNPAILRVFTQLSASVRSVKEAAQQTDMQHRLVVTGYSLGAMQALLMAMLYCDDTMQKTTKSLGITSTTFDTITVMLFAMPNAVRSGSTSAYVRRAVAKLKIGLYSVCQPFDMVEHLYCALPLSRSAVPYVHIICTDGIYRVEAANVRHGALYDAMWRVPWSPWELCLLARTVWYAVKLAASTHMLTEYERKLRILHGTVCT